jgi:hypothetical protein
VRKRLLRRPTFAVLIPVTLAIISITAAWIGYRSNELSGTAGGASRTIIIESTRRNASSANRSLFVNLETLAVRRFIGLDAELKTLRASDSETDKTIEASLSHDLVPVIIDEAELLKNPKYRSPNGVYDIDARIRDQEGVRFIDPAITFQKADVAESEQRWMAATAVLMTLPLFWTTLAELSTTAAVKRWSYLIGDVLFAMSIAIYLTIEQGVLG